MEEREGQGQIQKVIEENETRKQTRIEKILEDQEVRRRRMFNKIEDSTSEIVSLRSEMTEVKGDIQKV